MCRPTMLLTTGPASTSVSTVAAAEAVRNGPVWSARPVHSMSLAVWPAARSATIDNWASGSSGSRATPIGATSVGSLRPALALAHRAKPVTTGWVLDAPALVMPLIASCPTLPAVSPSVAGFGSTTDTNAGWTLGGGIEAAIAGPWTAKVEYLYVDLGNTNCSGYILSTNVDFHTNIVRAGLNYRF